MNKGDCISREDVSDALREIACEDDRLKSLMYEVIDIIETIPEIPREKQINTWTFCKDAMPEKDCMYFLFGKVHFVPDHVDDRDWYYGVSLGYYNARFGWITDNIEVIAWMPSPEPPEPYKSIIEKDKEMEQEHE